MGEETNVFILTIIQRRRQRQLLALLIIALILGAGAYMVLNVGGTGLSIGADSLPPDPTAISKEQRGLVNDPNAPTPILVNVVFQATDSGQFWLDGRLIATSKHHELKLPIGHHVLMYRSQGRTVMQRLHLEPNQTYTVQFTGQEARLMQEPLAAPSNP